MFDLGLSDDEIVLNYILFSPNVYFTWFYFSIINLMFLTKITLFVQHILLKLHYIFIFLLQRSIMTFSFFVPLIIIIIIIVVVVVVVVVQLLLFWLQGKFRALDNERVNLESNHNFALQVKQIQFTIIIKYYFNFYLSYNN